MKLLNIDGKWIIIVSDDYLDDQTTDYLMLKFPTISKEYKLLNKGELIVFHGSKDILAIAVVVYKRKSKKKPQLHKIAVRIVIKP